MDLLGHFHRAQQELSLQHVQSLYSALQQQQQHQQILQADRHSLLLNGSDDQNCGPGESRQSYQNTCFGESRLDSIIE